MRSIQLKTDKTIRRPIPRTTLSICPEVCKDASTAPKQSVWLILVAILMKQSRLRFREGSLPPAVYKTVIKDWWGHKGSTQTRSTPSNARSDCVYQESIQLSSSSLRLEKVSRFHLSNIPLCASVCLNVGARESFSMVLHLIFWDRIKSLIEHETHQLTILLS